jgi:co-chaperonin GroES (HSP10)
MKLVGADDKPRSLTPEEAQKKIRLFNRNVLLQPHLSQKSGNRFKVLVVGDGWDEAQGMHRKMRVEPGDMVIVRPGSGGHVLLEGEALYEVDEDLLLGVLLKAEPQPTAAHLIDPNTKECTREGAESEADDEVSTHDWLGGTDIEMRCVRCGLSHDNYVAADYPKCGGGGSEK